MSRTQRIDGDLTLDPSGDLILQADTQITGNLTIIGATTTVETTNATLTDNIISLNDGEVGAGVTAQYSGLSVDRGSLDPALFVFDEVTDTWLVSSDNGVSYQTVLTSAGGATGLTAVVDDLTPQLGGDLDVNGSDIVSLSNQDIQILPNGTGNVAIGTTLKMNDQSVTPAGNANATILYADTASGGGTGLFFVDDTETDELVSKSKAIVYGLIF